MHIYSGLIYIYIIVSSHMNSLLNVRYGGQITRQVIFFVRNRSKKKSKWLNINFICFGIKESKMQSIEWPLTE